MSGQMLRSRARSAGVGKSVRTGPRFLSLIVSTFLIVGLAVPGLQAADEESENAKITEGESVSAEKTADGGGENDEKAKKKKGPPFIAIPIFITEPAIGYGLGGAVGYFHKKKHQDAPDSDSVSRIQTADTAADVGGQHKVPPTISGVVAAYTEKGTWVVGLAHTASWKKDTMRYKGAVGYAHIVSTLYIDDRPAEFKLDTGLFYQDLKFRMGSSNFFVGGKLVYLTPELLFDQDLPDVPGLEDRLKLNDFGLAAQAEYDVRDNNMTPNRGQYVEFVAWKHLEVLGGETDYWNVGLMVDSFHELANKKLVLGLHLDLDTAGGDLPLWSYPYVTMRGIPALRYQNESTAVVEGELRWNLAERWAAVGFLGVGATRGDVPIFQDESGLVAGGLGGRYLFRPQDSLWVGLDVAKGPEQYVLYIVAGHKW